MTEFSHFDAEGRAQMVDVGAKNPTHRVAIATATIEMKPGTLSKIKAGDFEKGNVLEIARLAGIMATKRTSDLIPLCHPIAVTSVNVDFEMIDDQNRIEVTAKVEAMDRTGVEMEALTAATTSALTIYDMCKSVDREMEISSVHLIHKSGGKSGTFDRESESTSPGHGD